ncbi:hypothetical protein JHN63_28630 [Streptomyces sp. MBT65]|uniref:hypothetical protein n=1 Tax=Streptomyces sp. MBT65 TaxID=1488395 RepID=UPI00190BF4C0|nr:hypothetical protein [Streptomyces sp. MBT65]MBK3577697.1 hypothetical protein [Streptomyces sp. MBT65]
MAVTAVIIAATTPPFAPSAMTNSTGAVGDSLDFHKGSPKMIIFGISVTCTSNPDQSPGPSVFS